MSHFVARWLFTLYWLGGFCFVQAAKNATTTMVLGLIRVIDEQGRSPTYVYDAAAILFRDCGNERSAGPSVTAISPSNLRRGETKAFQITGQDLQVLSERG